jgi:regulatory protein
MQSRKPPRKLAQEALFDYAVRSLAARACSSSELRLRLSRRAEQQSDVETCIARLKDLGYLDDKKFAEAYTAMRVENAGFGRIRVLQDLRGRRVAPALASKAVSDAFEGKNEHEMVASYVTRRMPSFAKSLHEPPDKEERKLAAAYRKLRRAGFSSGAVLVVLKRLAARPEMLSEPPPDDEPDEC